MISILVALTLTLALSACGWWGSAGDPNVAATNEPTSETMKPDKTPEPTKTPTTTLKESDAFSYVVLPDGKRCEISKCKTEAKAITIPDEIDGYPVVGIGGYSFDGCVAEEIYLPDSLEYVSSFAFYQCENLRSIDFGNSAKRIGTYVVVYCDALEEIRFPENIESAGSPLIGFCPILNAVYMQGTSFPESVSIANKDDCPEIVIYTMFDSAVEHAAQNDGLKVEIIPAEDFSK